MERTYTQTNKQTNGGQNYILRPSLRGVDDKYLYSITVIEC